MYLLNLFHKALKERKYPTVNLCITLLPTTTHYLIFYDLKQHLRQNSSSISHVTALIKTLINTKGYTPDNEFLQDLKTAVNGILKGSPHSYLYSSNYDDVIFLEILKECGIVIKDEKHSTLDTIKTFIKTSLDKISHILG